MTDPRQFEYMQRKREEARTQGTRLKKGGPVKKYQEGGTVEESKDKYPSERSRLKKELAILRQQRGRFDTEQDPTGDRQAIFDRPFAAERPSPFYPLVGRRVESPQRQLEQERLRRQEEANQRIDRARERLDERIAETEGHLSDMGSKENKTAYKKGGKVSGKKWIQGAIKKPGALKAQMGVKAGQKIPAKKLASAAKAPGKLGQRARLAQTLGKMKKK
jgi:hypothetical protein